MKHTTANRITSIAVAAAILAVVVLAAILAPTRARAEGPFSSWAVAVVAGDWQRRQGVSSWAYDNARHDVAKALATIGFDPAKIRQFSAQPDWFPDERLPMAEVSDVGRALHNMVQAGGQGCLLYLTTHGRRDGSVWLGREWVSPDELQEMLDDSCGERPAIVVISACYSGAMVPALQSPQRFILTAARADRQSFLCGVEEHPIFDTCFLQSLPGARDFIALAGSVQSCIAAREREKQISPPSEPQVFVGEGVAPMLRTYTFLHLASACRVSLTNPGGC